MAIFGKAKLREIFEQAEIEVSKDVLNRICDLHTDSLDGLNDTVKDLKESLATAERERDDYKAKAPKDGVETVPKSDYDKIKKEYDDYKAGIDAEKHTETIKTEWAEFIETTTTRGANTANPPANNGNSGVTKEDFQKMSYKDRLQIYNENPDLYNELTT